MRTDSPTYRRRFRVFGADIRGKAEKGIWLDIDDIVATSRERYEKHVKHDE